MCCSQFPFLPWAVAVLLGADSSAAVLDRERFPWCGARSVRPQRIPVAARDNRGRGGGDCPLLSAACEATPSAVSSCGSSTHRDVSNSRSSSVWSGVKVLEHVMHKLVTNIGTSSAALLHLFSYLRALYFQMASVPLTKNSVSEN